MFDDKKLLITGGTGTFGKNFTKRILNEYNPKKIIIYSRDEYKQSLMQKQFEKNANKIIFFIGDVRDRKRLFRVFDGVDIVIHAAALKQVPTTEYNPIEAVKTNIYGTECIIDAAIDKGVKKVIALSTDKAVNPINLYGATKLVSDKLFIAGNAYTMDKDTSFSVVRYGNIAGARGSVIPFFKSLVEKKENSIPITDSRMTRFWMTPDDAVELVIKAIENSQGGEIFVPKCASFKITDLAKAIKNDYEMDNIGIRPGEKLHEVMIAEEDSRTTYEYNDYFIIYPSLNWWKETNMNHNGKKVEENFRYSSNNNIYLNVEEIRGLLNKMDVI